MRLYKYSPISNFQMDDNTTEVSTGVAQEIGGFANNVVDKLSAEPCILAIVIVVVSAFVATSFIVRAAFSLAKEQVRSIQNSSNRQ